MLDRTNPGVADRVIELVRDLLAKRSITRPVARDDNLTDCGLTSLDMVNLMLGVETEFAVKISDSDMTPANFRTVARIEALVSRLLSEAPHAV